MFGKRVVMAAAVGLAVFAGGFGSSTGSVHAQDRLAAIARPDLALTARDLPPGYEETTAVGLRLGEADVDDHMLLRTTPGVGPIFIWSATFKATTPVTDERSGPSPPRVRLIYQPSRRSLSRGTWRGKRVQRGGVNS